MKTTSSITSLPYPLKLHLIRQKRSSVLLGKLDQHFFLKKEKKVLTLDDIISV